MHGCSSISVPPTQLPRSRSPRFFYPCVASHCGPRLSTACCSVRGAALHAARVPPNDHSRISCHITGVQHVRVTRLPRRTQQAPACLARARAAVRGEHALFNLLLFCFSSPSAVVGRVQTLPAPACRTLVEFGRTGFKCARALPQFGLIQSTMPATVYKNVVWHLVRTGRVLAGRRRSATPTAVPCGPCLHMPVTAHAWSTPALCRRVHSAPPPPASHMRPPLQQEPRRRVRRRRSSRRGRASHTAAAAHAQAGSIVRDSVRRRRRRRRRAEQAAQARRGAEPREPRARERLRRRHLGGSAASARAPPTAHRPALIYRSTAHVLQCTHRPLSAYAPHALPP